MEDIIYTGAWYSAVVCVLVLPCYEY